MECVRPKICFQVCNDGYEFESGENEEMVKCKNNEWILSNCIGRPRFIVFFSFKTIYENLESQKIQN